MSAGCEKRPFRVIETNPHIYDLIPHPLDKGIVEPTLEDWVKKNPKDPSGYRWLGGEDNWRKSISLDKNEQISRERLIRSLIYNAYYSTHHLPEGYIGTPAQDLLWLSEVKVLLDDLDSENLKSKFYAEIADYRELVLSYQDYEKSTYVGPFESWADLNNRRCH